MIGDNPDGDIEGANRKGWESILVRTGIFESKEPNHHKYPAKYVVDDMEAAVKLIFEKENMLF
jgi:ribonucleotide monophosphatase NagD (HAD superfamily)